MFLHFTIFKYAQEGLKIAMIMIGDCEQRKYLKR